MDSPFHCCVRFRKISPVMMAPFPVFQRDVLFFAWTSTRSEIAALRDGVCVHTVLGVKGSDVVMHSHGHPLSRKDSQHGVKLGLIEIVRCGEGVATQRQQVPGGDRIGHVE